MQRKIRRSMNWIVLALLLSLPALAQTVTRVPVLIVSLDGFRNSYLDRTDLYDAPNLRRMAREGVRAAALIPVVPTKTFPNHYAIATGLYPAHNGIVGNHMYDPAMKAMFSPNDREAVGDARWWQGEPIWVTAEKQGCKTSVQFWPGSEAAIEGIRPSRWQPYDGQVPNRQRMDAAASLLARDPSYCLAMAYISNVDAAGHRFGPDAPETREAVKTVDSAIGHLVETLQAEGLWGHVDLIVVSDHGMTATPESQWIALDDYLDPSQIKIFDSSPLLEMRAKDGNQAALVDRLNRIPHLHAYLAQDAPARWHFKGNARIAPVLAMAEEGWTFDTRDRLTRMRGQNAGSHGFDNDLESMQAIFLAIGPDFTPGAKLPAFENVNLYALLTALLHLKPAANDGSLTVFHPALRVATLPATATH